MKVLLAIVLSGILFLNCSCNPEKKNDAVDQVPAFPDYTESLKKPEVKVDLSFSGQDCASCHASDTKMTGPSFSEISKKYPLSKENIEALAIKIKNGGSGVWGNVPMPPHPSITEEQAKEMAEKIIGYKK